MLFNSYIFIFGFLPVTLLGFFWLARRSHAYAAAWLALASLFFYGYWNPAYIGLLLGSIVCNYAFGLWMAKAQLRAQSQLGSGGRKKHILVFAIAANLSLLAYYKYANFFVSNVDAVLGTGWNVSNIILPLGISFFTFTQIAFLVDTYQGKVKEYNFIHYVLFVTYFPHLIAGPVLHHKEMMPQFARPSTYRINWEHVATGLMLFTLGLCKKTLWADPIAAYVDGIFSGVGLGLTPTIYEAWCGALAYTLQIYFDFSGYTDMALGIALMFGIKLPINFDSPYKATSIIEFWRRWHMTLSSWLRDYLYISLLGGNRGGRVRTYINMLLTMSIGGLWHGGESWNFLIWGVIHGSALSIARAYNNMGYSMPDFFSRLLTLVVVMLAWTIFRAADFSAALHVWGGQFGLNGIAMGDEVALAMRPTLYASFIIGIICIGYPATRFAKQEWGLFSHSVWRAVWPTLAFAYALVVLTGQQSPPFLYFQF